MGSEVVRLGAWCDLETVEEERDRLLAVAAAADEPPPAPGDEPRPALFVPGPGWPSPEERAARGLSFRVEEFAVLTGGRRLRLHADRGFGLGGPADPWAHLTLASLRADVLTTVLPDDAEETGEDHPWDRLAELLRDQGVEASAADLRGLPYDVEFGDRVRARLAG